MEYNNFKKTDAGCDKYGIPRLKLAVYLRDNVLDQLDKHTFIENGTLLGAYRNQKFIPHDDDFDFGFYDFVENTDNMPIHLRNTLLNSIVDKNDKESFSWTPPSKPPRISSLTT